jgi:hypothetical protein
MTRSTKSQRSADEAATSPTSGPVANAADKALVSRAYKKVLEGADLSTQERLALKRHEKEKEERLRWSYYKAIPQKHWREMSGRQTKVLNEQAARYGIPFGGATINLPAVARALHDFLADNAVKLAKDDDDLMQGSGSPALERYREEKAAMARLDRLEREGELVRRDSAREALGRIAETLRAAGETLQRQFGPQAVEILYEALDDAEQEVRRTFGEDADDPKS